MKTIVQVGVVALFVAVLAASGGCASASAKPKPVEVPPLNVPPPPPRVVEPTPPPEPSPQPVPDLPAAPAARPSRPATHETKEPAKPPEQKPEAPPEPVPAPPAPQQGGASPLRTPQTANDTEAAQNVKATIDRGWALLNSVNYTTLSDDRQKAYNDAKLFLTQAADAMKQGNYQFAQGVAVKGEALARELAGK